ncbi:MAG TPA: M61 family peptidase, partial [Verrucomicrobiae bacterium]|nr:M61 family peptidase [Verrucomicrobiae bacterium]
YSLGVSFGSDGGISDVIPGSPADKAGIGPAMKLVAVNGRAWSAKILRDAVKDAATNSVPIELLVQFNDYYKTYALDYHEGEKYPFLERNPAKPDLIADIVKPLTPEPVADSTGKK